MKVVKNVPKDTIELHNTLDHYLACRISSSWYILVKYKGLFRAIKIFNNNLLPESYPLAEWYDRSSVMHAFDSFEDLCKFMLLDED